MTDADLSIDFFGTGTKVVARQSMKEPDDSRNFHRTWLVEVTAE
jgi:hypothetical protein